MKSFLEFINEEGEPFKKTVKAYKLFKTHPKHPGKIFPLFVNNKEPVETGKWVKAKAGPPGKKNTKKVSSSIGDLAYRPGWHSGDMPIAHHIGGKSKKGLKKPDYRPDHHVWAEVEHPADVDWQSVANSRAQKTKKGKVKPVTAHITDQVPHGGHYRYKTNPNMTGNWIISGDMKVNRVLSDDEVHSINKKHGVADLPRKKKPINEVSVSKIENYLKDVRYAWKKKDKRKKMMRLAMDKLLKADGFKKGSAKIAAGEPKVAFFEGSINEVTKKYLNKHYNKAAGKSLDLAYQKDWKSSDKLDKRAEKIKKYMRKKGMGFPDPVDDGKPDELQQRYDGLGHKGD